MYFGDHPLTDTVAVKQGTDWHAVAILEEMVHKRLAGPEDCPIRQADGESASFLRPGCEHWSEFFPAELRPDPLLIEKFLLDHSSIVVPHLDALAVRPAKHKFSINASGQPYAGLHYHE